MKQLDTRFTYQRLQKSNPGNPRVACSPLVALPVSLPRALDHLFYKRPHYYYVHLPLTSEG